MQQEQLEVWHVQDDGSGDSRDKDEHDRERHESRGREREKKHVGVSSEVRPSRVEVAKVDFINRACLQHVDPPRMAR